MKKIVLFALPVGIFILFLFSCQNGKNDKHIERPDNKVVLADLIQYDVFIKNPDPDQEWYVQNMEGRDRDQFVKRIMYAANSGDHRLYNYFFNTPLTPEEINAIFNKTDSVTMQRPSPPYDWYDTVMVSKLNEKDITKVRFLEEWYIDKEKLIIEKKIVGIAPLLENYNEYGDFRGYIPMFWMYLDEKYPLND